MSCIYKDCNNMKFAQVEHKYIDDDNKSQLDILIYCIHHWRLVKGYHDLKNVKVMFRQCYNCSLIYSINYDTCTRCKKSNPSYSQDRSYLRKSKGNDCVLNRKKLFQRAMSNKRGVYKWLKKHKK